MNAIVESLIEQGFTVEQTKLALLDWDIEPIMSGEQQVGEFMIRHNEVHFALLKQHRKKLGRLQLIDNGLRKLLETRPFIVTRLFIGDKHRKLIELIGFKCIKSDEQYDYFWLDEDTRYARHS